MEKSKANNIEFRASQAHLICGGTIGLTDVQKNKLQGYIDRQELAKVGDAKPLTPNMILDMDKLLDVRNNPTLPKTLQSEVKKIYRAEKYNRNFEFTNKYIQKGIWQEEEAITTYQSWLKAQGKNVFFKKNDVRLHNGFITGEPDLIIGNDIKNCKEGADIKCSYSLESFPFESDTLTDNYELQNQCYMWLTGAKKWTTAYCLVNATEHQLHTEKQKWYYAVGMHDTAGMTDEKLLELENLYEEKSRNVEKMLIYDYDRFVHVNPGHLMSFTREEWYGNDLDIPIQDRVIEKISVYDPEKIEFLKERIELSRSFMMTL